jgi:hypothetical protein
MYKLRIYFRNAVEEDEDGNLFLDRNGFEQFIGHSNGHAIVELDDGTKSRARGLYPNNEYKDEAKSIKDAKKYQEQHPDEKVFYVKEFDLTKEGYEGGWNVMKEFEPYVGKEIPKEVLGRIWTLFGYNCSDLANTVYRATGLPGNFTDKMTTPEVDQVPGLVALYVKTLGGFGVGDKSRIVLGKSVKDVAEKYNVPEWRVSQKEVTPGLPDADFAISEEVANQNIFEIKPNPEVVASPASEEPTFAKAPEPIQAPAPERIQAPAPQVLAEAEEATEEFQAAQVLQKRIEAVREFQISHSNDPAWTEKQWESYTEAQKIKILPRLELAQIAQQQHQKFLQSENYLQSVEAKKAAQIAQQRQELAQIAQERAAALPPGYFEAKQREHKEYLKRVEEERQSKIAAQIAQQREEYLQSKEYQLRQQAAQQADQAQVLQKIQQLAQETQQMVLRSDSDDNDHDGRDDYDMGGSCHGGDSISDNSGNDWDINVTSCLGMSDDECLGDSYCSYP